MLDIKAVQKAVKLIRDLESAMKTGDVVGVLQIVYDYDKPEEPVVNPHATPLAAAEAAQRTGDRSGKTR